MHRLTAVLAVALLALAACSDEAGTPPEPTGLRIVSGANQTAMVALPDAGSAAQPGVSAVTVPGSDAEVLPEPVVAEITYSDGSTSTTLVAPDGVSLQVAPEAAPTVAFRVIQPELERATDRHCGRAFVGSAQPSEPGDTVSDFWELATYAGTCEMEVRLIDDGQPVVARTVTATFTPGPAAQYSQAGSGANHWAMPWTLPEYLVRDANGNGALYRLVLAPNSVVAVRGTEPGTTDARTLEYQDGADPTGDERIWVGVVSAGDTLVTGVIHDLDGDTGSIAWVWDATLEGPMPRP